MIDLGVNIDHVATLREARKGSSPSVLEAARISEEAGAQQITIHLRQDRRHIQDHDVDTLRAALRVRMNLEMAAVDEIIAVAHRVRPAGVCLVPEKREEITTEGGLDVAADEARLKGVVEGMHALGIKVSMFIDPEPRQVAASAATGADSVELHTGAYANADGEVQDRELERLRRAGADALEAGLALHAGHGLTVGNLEAVARIPGMKEVNIGHDIIARAIFVGLESAVKEIMEVLKRSAVR